jgi:Family of unknown function (DUF6267)
MANLFEFVQFLTEGARTPHPEDFIFQGSDSAMDAINGIVSAVDKPQTVTIKWDGSPAIVFGRRTSDGMFTMNYKEYIGLPGGQVTTAQELLDYYIKNGKNIEVGRKLASAFNALGSICPPTFRGFVQGDLMWTEPLASHNNEFTFKPNPYGVTYRVPADSEIGQKIQGRQVGVAVHTIGTDVENNKETPLVGRRSMNGLEGLADSNQWCTVFTGNMGNTFKLKRPVKIENAARAAVNKFKSLGGDDFLASITGATKATLQTYYNRKVTGQPVDAAWLETKLSRTQLPIVNSEENKPVIAALDVVYNAIIALKLAVLQQLEPQVAGVGQYVGDVPKGEGFNIDSPSGFIKLVNRGVFSAANFAGRSQ